MQFLKSASSSKDVVETRGKSFNLSKDDERYALLIAKASARAHSHATGAAMEEIKFRLDACVRLKSRAGEWSVLASERPILGTLTCTAYVAFHFPAWRITCLCYYS